MSEPTWNLNDVHIIENSPLRVIESKIKELLEGAVLDDLSSLQRFDVAAKLTSQYVRVLTLMQAVQERLYEHDKDMVIQNMQRAMAGAKNDGIQSAEQPQNWKGEQDEDDDEEPLYSLIYHSEPS